VEEYSGLLLQTPEEYLASNRPECQRCQEIQKLAMGQTDGSFSAAFLFLEMKIVR
jgi:hypothetical protein